MGDPIANAIGDDLLYGGERDPRTSPGLNAPRGSIFIWAPETSDRPQVLQKTDQGLSTNWKSLAFVDNQTFTVGPQGEYETIQAAIDAAKVSTLPNKLILVSPGDYAEDLLIDFTNVTISSITGSYDGVNILGQVTVNVAVDQFIPVVLKGLRIANENPTGNCLRVIGAVPHQMIIVSCLIQGFFSNSDAAFYVNHPSVFIQATSSGQLSHNNPVVPVTLVDNVGTMLWDNITTLNGGGGDRCLIVNGGLNLSFTNCLFITGNATEIIQINLLTNITFNGCTFSNFAGGNGFLLTNGAQLITGQCSFSIVGAGPAIKCVQGAPGTTWLDGSSVYFQNNEYDVANVTYVPLATTAVGT